MDKGNRTWRRCWSCSYRSRSPEGFDFVFSDKIVFGDENEIFNDGLSDQEPVKWITMMPRESQIRFTVFLP